MSDAEKAVIEAARAAAWASASLLAAVRDNTSMKLTASRIKAARAELEHALIVLGDFKG